MTKLNAKVDVEGQNYQKVAQDFINKQVTIEQKKDTSGKGHCR